MRTLIIVAVLAAGAAACGGSQAAPDRDFSVGGLYWAPTDGGGIGIYKLVAIDDEGVHMRVYSNAFAQPPSAVDESVLYIGGPPRSPADQEGFEHTFVAWEWFDGWETGFIQQSSVADNELDGYRRWLVEQSPAYD